MSVELLQTLSMVGYILSAVLFLVTIILFFWLKVPELISDLTGATERKAVENIRQQNMDSGATHTPRVVNAVRGKLTDKISPSGRLQHHSASIGLAMATAKISTQKLPQAGGMETTVLGGQTMETTVLDGQLMETTVLGSGSAIVSLENAQTAVVPEKALPVLKIEIDIGFWESSEIIA